MYSTGLGITVSCSGCLRKPLQNLPENYTHDQMFDTSGHHVVLGHLEPEQFGEHELNEKEALEGGLKAVSVAKIRQKFAASGWYEMRSGKCGDFGIIVEGVEREDDEPMYRVLVSGARLVYFPHRYIHSPDAVYLAQHPERA